MQFIERFGPLSMFLILLLDSLGIPLPTELSIILAGAMIKNGTFDWTFTILASVAGFAIGCWGSYRLGASVGARLLEKYGRYVGIQPSHLAKAEEWVRRYGVWSVFLGRLIPVVRNMAGYPAGAVGMPKGLYWLGSLCGYALYVSLNLFVGYKVGGEWRRIMANAEEWLWIAAVVVALYLGFRYWRHLKKKRAEEQGRQP